MSEKTKENATADATTTTSAAPDETTTTGPTSNVVKTPNTDAHAQQDKGEKPADRGPTSLTVATSTAGAVTVLTGSAIAAAAGPVTAAVVTAAAVGTGVVMVVRRRRNRKAAAHAANGTGGTSRRKVAGRGGRGLGLGGGRRRSPRVSGLGGKGKGLGTRPKRSTARTAAKKAVPKRPLGATPKRGRGVASTTKPKSKTRSLGRTLGKKANPSTTRGRGSGRGRGPGRGRGRSLLGGGRSLFGGRGKASTSPKSKGKGSTSKAKKKDKAKSKRRRRWFGGVTRRVAGASRWGGKHLRRWGWWLWGPKGDPDPVNVDDPTDPTDEAGDEGKKRKKKRRKVDPDGRGAPGDQPDSTSRPTSGPAYTGATMSFFQNLREAVDSDFTSMRNTFNEPTGGTWTDTKEAMREIAEVYHALGAQMRLLANDTHDKGGYTAAFGEFVHQLGGHSTKVGDGSIEALSVLMNAHGELIEYAENDTTGRFDQSRNQR